MQNLGQCHGQSKGKAELLQAMAWQNRKKAMFAICELPNVLLVSMRSIMSSQTANVFGFEPLCNRTLQLKRQDRVERRQWLPSGSCLKSCPVGNVFNSISNDRMTVLLQITAKYRRRRNIRGQSRKKAVVAIWELPYWPAAHHAPTLTWILHIYINAGLQSARA